MDQTPSRRVVATGRNGRSSFRVWAGRWKGAVRPPSRRPAAPSGDDVHVGRRYLPWYSVVLPLYEPSVEKADTLFSPACLLRPNRMSHSSLTTAEPLRPSSSKRSAQLSRTFPARVIAATQYQNQPSAFDEVSTVSQVLVGLGCCQSNVASPTFWATTQARASVIPIASLCPSPRPRGSSRHGGPFCGHR